MDGAVVAGDLPANDTVHHDLAVAVITPVGTFPGDDDFRRVPETEIVARVLEQAARKLKLTNTADWVAHADGRHLNTHETFKANGLRGICEIEWHKHEGGGGA